MTATDVLVILVEVWFSELGHMVATGDIAGVVIWVMAGAFVGFFVVTLVRLVVATALAVTRTIRRGIGGGPRLTLLQGMTGD